MRVFREVPSRVVLRFLPIAYRLDNFDRVFRLFQTEPVSASIEINFLRRNRSRFCIVIISNTINVWKTRQKTKRYTVNGDWVSNFTIISDTV